MNLLEDLFPKVTETPEMNYKSLEETAPWRNGSKNSYMPHLEKPMFLFELRDVLKIQKSEVGLGVHGFSLAMDGKYGNGVLVLPISLKRVEQQT